MIEDKTEAAPVKPKPANSVSPSRMPLRGQVVVGRLVDDKTVVLPDGRVLDGLKEMVIEVSKTSTIKVRYQAETVPGIPSAMGQRVRERDFRQEEVAIWVKPVASKGGYVNLDAVFLLPLSEVHL